MQQYGVEGERERQRLVVLAGVEGEEIGHRQCLLCGHYPAHACVGRGYVMVDVHIYIYIYRYVCI